MDIRSLLSTLHDHETHLPHHQKIALRIFVLLLVILVVIILLKSCQAIFSNQQKTTTAPMLIRQDHNIKIPEHSPLRSQMVVQTVNTSKAPHVVVFPGIVEADPSRMVTILPPSTGHLIDLKINLGDDVKQGQLLATMQSAGLAQAYSDEMKALSILKQTEEALRRAQKVNRAGANSIKDIEQAQSNYSQAQAELQRAQTTLKALGGNQPNPLSIQAPIDGKVIALNYGIGSYINDPTAPMLTIANIQAVWITASIPEHLIASVNKGQNVQVSLTAYPKQTWQGKVSFINSLMDPDTRTNKTRIAFTNPDEKLQPNMFASVRVELPQQEQVIVPLSAILMNNDTTSVYIETAPWTFKRRAVVLGNEDENNVRITSGLKAGDRIVVTGGILVND